MTSDGLNISAALDISRQRVRSANVDISAVNQALDTIATVAASSSDIFELWSTIDEQIGKAQSGELQQIFKELRTCVQIETLTDKVDRLKKVFSVSPEDGRRQWLLLLAKSMTSFRMDFCIRLCEALSFIAAADRHTVEQHRRAARYMFQNRWIEAYDQLHDLAEYEFLPDLIRARLLSILGQIHLYWFWKTARAKELFDMAQRLAPDDGVLASSMGDYWAAEERKERAISCYENAIRLAPGAPDGYIGMGEYAEKENRLDIAEKWYRDVISAAAGDRQGYDKLLRLYGRPELFEEHKDALPSLMEQAIAVEPEAEYDSYLTLGTIYDQNTRYDQARKLFKKAVALDATRPQGYIALAESYATENRDEEAVAAYNKAVEAAPECHEGYWALAQYYAQQEKWQDALEWYRKVPQHVKEWAGVVRAEIANVLPKLGKYSEAEASLKLEIQIDKYNARAQQILEELAYGYYKDRGEPDQAERIYGDILKIVGDGYKKNYHNKMGNLRYHQGDYDRAAAEYRQAIKDSPDDPGYHRDLAVTLGELKNYANAVEELESARGFGYDEKAYRTEMALLLNGEANDFYQQDDYQSAIDLYSKAIEYDASFDIIHSNLADAWERLERPGRITEALEKAIAAFRRALSIRHDEKYERNIEKLCRKQEFVARYGEDAVGKLQFVAPIVLEVADDLVPYVSKPEGGLADALTKRLSDMKARLSERFGFPIPGVRFRANEIADGTYTIMVMEVPVVSGRIWPDKRFSPGSEPIQAALGVIGEAAANPETGSDGFWIERDDWRKLETNDVELWDIIEFPLRHMESVIQENLSELMGHQEAVGVLENEAPHVVEELRRSPEKLTALVTSCRGLLAEQVPISPLSLLYDAFDRLYSERISIREIIERLRNSLLRMKLPGNDDAWSMVAPGPKFEAEIWDCIYHGKSNSVLAMEPQHCQDALTTLKNCVNSNDRIALLIERGELRPFIRRLVELEFSRIPVLSRRELRADLQVTAANLTEADRAIATAPPPFSRRVASGEAIDEPDEKSGLEVSLPSSAIAITVFITQEFMGTASPADDQPIKEMFSLVRDGLFYELGIMLPEIAIKVDNHLQPNEFQFELNGLPYSPSTGLDRVEFMVNDSWERLKLLNINGTKHQNPATANECTIVRDDLASLDLCKKLGITTWGPAGYLVLALSAAIRKNAATFQTVDATRYYLDSLDITFPDLVKTALRRFSVDQICLVLRNLLDEGITIRDLRSILESMLSINGTTDIDIDRYIVFMASGAGLCPVAGDRGLESLSSLDYSNFVRTALKRYISNEYSKGSGTLIAYLLDHATEARIRDSDQRPLTDVEITSFSSAVEDELRHNPGLSQRPVLLTNMDLRRRVRKLVEAKFPHLAVVCYQELSPDMKIQPIGRISWGDLASDIAARD